MNGLVFFQGHEQTEQLQSILGGEVSMRTRMQVKEILDGYCHGFEEVSLG